VLFRPLAVLTLAAVAAIAQPAIPELVKEWSAATTPDARRAFLDRHAPYPAPLADDISKAGEALVRKSLYDDALAYYDLSVAMAEYTGDNLTAAISCQLIGSALRLRGEYPESIASYQRAIAFVKKTGNQARLSVILSNLGGVYASQSRFSDALRLLEESISVMPPDSPPIYTAPAHQNMGIIYALQGDHPRALQKFSTVLDIYEKIGNRQKVALTQQNLGVLQTKQGNFEGARAHLLASLKIAEEELKDPTQIAQTVNELGLLYLRQGNYPDAQRALERTRAIVDPLQLKLHMGDVRNNLADLYARQGRYTDALSLLREAAAIFETQEDALNLARTLRGTSVALAHTGDHEAARAAAARAVELSRKIGDLDGEWQGRTLEARALQGLRRPVDAIRDLESAVGVIESQRLRVAGGDEERQRYFEQAAFPYHSLIDLTLAAGRSFDALGYAERAKARVLLDVLAHGPERVEREMTDAERNEESALLSDLAAVDAQLQKAAPARRPALEARRDDLRRKHAIFMTRLYASHPDLRVRRGEAPALTESELAGLLAGPNEALVQYVTAEDRAWLFVVTRTAAGKPRIDHYAIPVARDALGRRAQELRDAIARRDPAFRRYSRALYDLLVQPAAARLAGKTRIRIVPDGPLWELPFHTLTSPAGRYWIEDATLSWAPSFTALRDLRARPAPSSTRLLAMGDPIQEGVERAPETARQVQLIADTYGRASAAVFTGPAATEDRFREESKDAGILHLATHSMLDPASPLYGRLAFSGGFLEAWELMRMNLNARLAVLSACETARGQVAQGEGIIGLNWALFVAGVPSTVVSQWKVEATSATSLLVSFYRQMKKQPSLAASLRAAALETKSDPRYEHPFYWAPFILVGRDR
jgi:CHAT domain-containing protein/Tfp pilus assembly protein PilF